MQKFKFVTLISQTQAIIQGWIHASPKGMLVGRGNDAEVFFSFFLMKFFFNMIFDNGWRLEYINQERKDKTNEDIFMMWKIWL